jgi:hypothetical protein
VLANFIITLFKVVYRESECVGMLGKREEKRMNVLRYSYVAFKARKDTKLTLGKFAGSKNSSKVKGG